MKKIFTFVLIGILILSLLVISAQNVVAQSNTLIFATLGDYGVNNEYEAAVASMVSNWNPDLILGLGDNYYAEAGGTGSEKYDLSTGKYFCNFLKDITTTGTFCPTGQSSINRFFPALGDHDYADGGMNNANLPMTYTDYFNLPGAGYTSSSNNERYYDFVSGPVHFFILNSIDEPGWEPDGAMSSSVQAQWLQTQLGASTSIWNVVVMPSPPYSSGIIHGSALHAQWPFAQWGADVVFSGDEHNYERILHDGIVYFVNGLGGQWPYQFGTPVEGSSFRYNTKNGAQRVIVTDTSMTFEFYSVENGGTLQDTYTITVPHNTATPTLPVNSTGWQSPTTQQAVTNNAGDNNGYESNPTYAFTNDGLVARDLDSGTSPSTNCTISGIDKHRFFNYSFTIPTGAMVQGIQARLDANADAIIGAPKLCISLSWDNGSHWSDWKTTPTLTDSEQSYLLGGTTDTWGHAWTTAELGNTNFQVRIADIASDNSRDFSLDWIAVNIVYSLSSTSTPTNTPTATYTLTSSPSPTATSSPTETNTPTNLPSSTSTDTPTATDTPASTSTDTFTPTATSTGTNTPTNTATSTPSLTFTPTDAPTLAPTATNTVTNTPTATQTAVNTATSTNTSTSTPMATQLPTSSSIQVRMNGELQGSPFSVGKSQSLTMSYPGVNNGAVKILSTNNVPVVGSERVIYKVNGVNTSFSEMMALPNGQLDQTYWLPWYNNVDLDTQLRMGNVSGSPATVHLWIGGQEMTSGCTPSNSPYSLAAGASLRVSCAGVNRGPVQIVSNQNIVAAERVIYNVNNLPTSFSEMMALPNLQLGKIYWLPRYNNIDLDTQLRIGNVSGSPATVRVYIGGQEMTSGCTPSNSPYSLAAGASLRVSCAGRNNGPVQIVSTQNIVAAERVIYNVNNLPTSFSEMMALPNSQLDTLYWLPWYNNIDLDSQLRFGVP
jgi:Calcineurin-like phosphoesterase